ncbi:MAG: hypothetical protein KY453_05940 [Gemmatimonadetes bacterium]|nr:hypothetical protein [Gemmatimonadota bacterium]
MKRSLAVGLIGLGMMGCTATADTQPMEEGNGHLNPMISLHEAGEPVFGLYAPSPRPRRAPGATSPAPAPKSPAELAREAMAFESSDYVFDGSMEGGVDENLPAFTAFVDALREEGARAGTHPLVVKMAPIAPDPDGAAEDIARQLDAGVSGIMFVEAESAEEVRRGIAAMRYAADGGTRPDRVGSAPAYWGVSDAEYREMADVWPLDPEGELINWTIVESAEGLANVREIAAVEGIGVLWPGAGTLRGLYTTTGPDGERVFDAEGWEGAIQTVLAACKEFDVACGYPANADDIQMRMEQGFSVFVMGWGESGFETVEKGRELAGR